MKYLNHTTTTVCEFGCGPGLPSLAAAKRNANKVLATDLDTFALELVARAAAEQGLNVETQRFDLVKDDLDNLDRYDLYIMSDVFESQQVARGAAHITQQALSTGSSVWVFTQSDRAQREVYLEELRNLLKSDSLNWQSVEKGPPTSSPLWLVDVDETKVRYG
jgi:predicted nicotinamide N-methyase